MVLTDKNIQDFQDIYKKYFGKEISRKDALEQGTKLLRLISILYRPKEERSIIKINSKKYD